VTKPPKSLKRTGVAFWRQACSNFSFEAEDLAPLRDYCANLDFIAACEAAIEKEGLTVLGPRGKREAHPLIAPMRQAMRQNVALFRLLGFDASEDRDQGRDMLGRFAATGATPPLRAIGGKG
jgi:phage terminase small subunit